MKHKIIPLLLLFSLLSFTACTFYDTQTAQFYGTLNQTSFWFTAEITEYTASGSTSYTYTQAADADSVTTVRSSESGVDDYYKICQDGYAHFLNFKSKKYDTGGESYVEKLFFAKNQYEEFRSPKAVNESAVFDGVTCTRETFNMINGEGAVIGELNYYFTDRLLAVEWFENGKLVRVMRVTDYSETIPSDIHVSLPEDFKKGTYISEQIIDPFA